MVLTLSTSDRRVLSGMHCEVMTAFGQWCFVAVVGIIGWY